MRGKDRSFLAFAPYAVIWDLDSTLADTYHRQHMVPQIKAGEAAWVDYSLACAGDTPIEAAVELMWALQPRYYQMVVTGRNESARDLTEAWFREHDVPVDRLIMRADGDHTADGRFKLRVLDQLKADGVWPVLFIEDWPQVADEIREQAGIPVLVVNPCYPVDAPHQNTGVAPGAGL
jgi:hypothetical protein